MADSRMVTLALNSALRSPSTAGSMISSRLGAGRAPLKDHIWWNTASSTVRLTLACSYHRWHTKHTGGNKNVLEAGRSSLTGPAAFPSKHQNFIDACRVRTAHRSCLQNDGPKIHFKFSLMASVSLSFCLIRLSRYHS